MARHHPWAADVRHRPLPDIFAQALDAEGRWDAAEAVWRKLLSSSTEDYRLWTGLGVTLSHEKKYEDAIAAYRKALSLHPHDAETELNLGIAYFKAGKIPEAVAPLQAAAAQLPESEQINILLGMSLFGSGRYKAAIPYLEKTKAQDNPVLQQVLAQSYLEAGEYDKALSEFKRLLLRAPDAPAVHMLLGEAYDAENQSEQAIAEYRAATAKAYTPDAHFGLGYLLWKDRQYAAAAEEFQKELDNDPKNSLALAYLGDIALKQGDPAKAELLLRRAIALKGDLRVAHFDLGVIASDAKRYQQAEKEFTTAVRLAPQDADAHYRLARLYQASGRSVDAQRELAIVKQLHLRTREELLLKISGPPH